MDKNDLLSVIKIRLDLAKYILSARIYGSWLHNEKTVDVDIAVMVSGEYGIVDQDVYRSLSELRKGLSNETGSDIDLIPHTLDEFRDNRSPIWYPRYNPSLFFGETIKGKFSITPVCKKSVNFDFSDLTAYVLLDNRTICRRQLVRFLEGEAGRIYASKLLHGPGNALTYYACKNQVDYLCSPSDLVMCFEIFDEVYNLDSKMALHFLNNCKKDISFDKAVKLMSWYEHLVGLTLIPSFPHEKYQSICNKLGSLQI